MPEGSDRVGGDVQSEATVTAPPSLLGLRRIFRKASGLSVASLLASLLAIPASFIAARWLGPRRYGEGQFVVLCYFYAALIRSGIFEGSIRSLIDRRARGDEIGAIRDQNIGVTVEMAVSVIPGLVLAIVGITAGPSVRQLGFLLAPLAVVASTGNMMLSNLWAARDRFDVVARLSFLRAIVGPALLLGLVISIGTAGLFMAPLASDLVMGVVYLLVRPSVQLRPLFDLARARALLRVGFPLGAAGVVYWAYRLAGSTSLAVAASSATLGIYVFANAPITIATRAINGIQAVLIPAVWGQLANDGVNPGFMAQAERMTLAIAVIAGGTAGLAQAVFGPVVFAFLPGFSPAVRVFDILALTIFLLPVATIPSLVLDSSRVNRQSRQLGIWIVALVINYVANGAALTLGLGSVGLAVNDVWVQLLAVVFLFELSSQHIWGKARRRRLMLYAKLAAVFFVVLVITVILDENANQLTGRHLDAGVLVLRCAATGSVWVALGLVLLFPTVVTIPRPRRGG